ncbi:hypothetical protein ACJX0J_038821 [Zea mays]
MLLLNVAHMGDRNHAGGLGRQTRGVVVPDQDRLIIAKKKIYYGIIMLFREVQFSANTPQHVWSTPRMGAVLLLLLAVSKSDLTRAQERVVLVTCLRLLVFTHFVFSANEPMNLISILIGFSGINYIYYIIMMVCVVYLYTIIDQRSSSKQIFDRRLGNGKRERESFQLFCQENIEGLGLANTASYTMNLRVNFSNFF